MFTILVELALRNLLLLALHLESGSLFPTPLSPSEEADCFERMAAGDLSARSKLIEHNLRLVAHIIKKYYPVYKEQEDLISIGTIGLIKAVSTFKGDRNIRFATYASKCIENEILMHFRSQNKSSRDIFIDEPIETDRDGNTLSLLDIISDSVSIPECVELLTHSEKLYSIIGDCLTKREYEIIKHRYGLYGVRPKTQREVAAMMKISRSYVSRIEKKALLTLKEHLEGDPPPQCRY